MAADYLGVVRQVDLPGDVVDGTDPLWRTLKNLLNPDSPTTLRRR